MALMIQILFLCFGVWKCFSRIQRVLDGFSGGDKGDQDVYASESLVKKLL